MFWGLTLESGKHYSQSVEDSFHVSMAALELDDNYKEGKSQPPIRVMVQHDKKDFLLCSLLYGSIIQQQLDLDFTEGEQVTFFLDGSGIVHLTGSLVQEKPFEVGDEPILGSPRESDEDGMEVSEDESDGKDEEDEEEVPSLQQLAQGEDVESDEEDEDDWIPEQEVSETHKKRKLKDSDSSQESKAMKKATGPKGITKETENSEDSDDEYADEADEYADDDDEENIGDEMTDLFDDIEAHGQTNGTTKDKPKSSAEEKKEPAGEKKQKQAFKKENVILSGDSSTTPSKKKKKKKQQGDAKDGSKSEEGSKQNVQKEKQDETPLPQTKRRKLPNGVITEDIVVGNGKIAKSHKMVGVYYRGVLAKSKQQFDSCLSGKPFRFRLGSQEVISGWDSGLVGMRVGGKRKLVIPASQGYGNSRAGKIPPNSTLIFEVELKEVR